MSYRSMLKTGKKKPTYCNIKAKIRTSDNQGGFTTTWAIIYRRILCRFNALSSEEIAVLWDKQAILADYKVNLEYLSGIKEGNRLIKMDDSREFEIKLKMDWDEDNQMLTLACHEIGRLE